MRTSSAAGLLFPLLLGACDRAETGATAQEAAGDSLIDCALAGASSFERACAVERIQSGEALMLVVRHPDGGFRRFEVLDGGRAIATADGAELAQNIAGDGGIEVAVGIDRYRIPAALADDAR